jgi:hypothetical protein
MGQNGYTIARSNGACWWPEREHGSKSDPIRVFPPDGGFEGTLESAVDELDLQDGEKVVMQYVDRDGSLGGIAILTVKLERVEIATSVEREYSPGYVI